MQTQDRHYSPSTLFLLVTFLAALAGLYLLPAGSLERTIIGRGAGLIFAVTMLLTVMRMPATHRPVWLFFWFYLAATVTADFIIFYQQKSLDAEPGPGLADLFYMSCYGFAFAGFALLARRPTLRQQLDVAIDAAIIGLAGLSVIYSLVIGPLISQAETVDLPLLVSVTYPLLDMFVFAALARVILLSSQRNSAILLFSAAMLTFLLIDLMTSYTLVNGGGFNIEPAWLAALAMIAVAASLPSAQDGSILAAEEGDHLTWLRAALLAIAILLPLAMAVQDLWWGDGLHAFWTVVIGAAVTVLVLLRAYRLVNTVQSQRSELELLLQQEARLRQAADAARRAAEDANAAKSEFLSVVSHELRTPLTVVLGAYELIRMADVPDNVRILAGKGLDSSQHLLKLIEDILDFSSSEVGRLSIVKAPFRLAVLLDEVRDTVAGLRKENVELSFDLAADLRSADVMSDALRLKQVLINLVGNALKFTERGSVVLSVKRTGGTAATPLVEFAVTDTGIGLTPEQQSRLFQPFTQVDMSNSRRHGGVGMGLVISQRLVQLLGGQSIDLQSSPGRGSRFAFQLPLPLAGEPVRP